MDAWRIPNGIGPAHLSDQATDLATCAWPSQRERERRYSLKGAKRQSDEVGSGTHLQGENR